MDQKKKKSNRTVDLQNKQTRKEIGDRKWESNDNPEIPDRSVTSEIPGLPSGDHLRNESLTDERCDLQFAFFFFFVISVWVLLTVRAGYTVSSTEE